MLFQRFIPLWKMCGHRLRPSWLITCTPVVFLGDRRPTQCDTRVYTNVIHKGLAAENGLYEDRGIRHK